ncbi:transglycosylase SLT domain-containing protein [Pseudomonas sp. EL_65y_Pfl2_R95]|uniref:transglycosylase SLT domain-containing protein n=1 Tax=Pseudomonas sp. EL_65y_Pfl2_R95 TaxID=3088698 RepID=UPI004040B4D1
MGQGRIAALLAALALLVGCSTAPPKDQNNLCNIYREYPDWYEDSLDMQDAYGTPINVAMAIIKQESSYVEDALPPRAYLLWVIPWGRVSSAYGYAQAQDPVWGEYKDQTGNGGSRDDFEDAIMFVGWYTNGTQRTLGVSKWDAYNQYLAYHEGRGGYSRGTYRSKAWLMQVARKVEQQAKNYGWQLKGCRAELESNRSWW